MTKLSGYHRLGLTLGLLFAMTAQTSHAASLFQIELIVSGGPDIVFDQTNPLNTSLDPNTISLDFKGVNALLAGTNLQFNSNLTANIVADPDSAKLFQTDSATVSSGTVSFSLIATANDYVVPTGNGLLSSSLGGNYTQTTAIANASAFTSYFDQTNGANLPGSVVSPTQNYSSPNTILNSSYGLPDPATVSGFSVSPGFALTNRVDITLAGGGGKAGTNQFTGSTILTAIAIPEPASVVMTLSAFPIALGLIRRYRRGVKSVG
jgi:hypothetical protein